jgi:hypothetical protein
MNDVILLALTDPLLGPTERVLSAPHQGANFEMLQAKFLPEFPPQSRFNRFAGFQPTAWSDPKPFPAIGRLNPQEKDFQIPGEKNGSDRLALNNQ